MFAPSLKSRIIFNIAMILTASILLTDFVLVSIIENRLVQKKVSQGKQLLLKSADIAVPDGLGTDGEAGVDSSDRLSDLFSDPAIVMGEVRVNDIPVFVFRPETAGGDISLQFYDAMDQQQAGKGQVRFAGKTWGVFWRQKKYAIISESVLKNNHSAVVAAIVYDLDDLYLTLRQSQRVIGFYGIANLLVLILLGFFRFSRLIIRPLDKFIKRAEDYRPEDRLNFLPDKKDHKLNRLSAALNRMIQRIEGDREKLQHSLAALEKTHKDLKKAQGEIIRAEKLAAIGRLSAGIAHEIGNPLGIVLGYLGLLKKHGLDPDDHTGQDYARRAEDEITRISVIIRQLLDLSRPSRSETAEIALHELIYETGRRMSDLPLMKHIEIVYRLSAWSDRILGDCSQIRQVLLNLIINAADSIAAANNPLKGKIELSTRIVYEKEDGAINGAPTLKLRVADNGTGISDDDIENIFDPFYTTKEPGKGTGLGLSVSYMIIEQAGGTIEADSRRHQGTTFTICLPLYTDAPESGYNPPVISKVDCT